VVPCRLLPPKTSPRWLTIMALYVHKVTVKSSSMGWKTLSSTIIITISKIQMAPHTRLREFLNLQNIFRELLLAFVERSKQRPKQLIFYRLVVSSSKLFWLTCNGNWLPLSPLGNKANSFFLMQSLVGSALVPRTWKRTLSICEDNLVNHLKFWLLVSYLIV
jgi:hypothetical protein